MSTRWFNIGIRWMNGNLTQGMRQSGSAFRGMIDGQIADLRRLEQKQRDLARLESQARDMLRTEEAKIAARKKRERLDNARLRGEIDAQTAALRRLHAERKAALEEVARANKAQHDEISRLEKAEELRRKQARLAAKKRGADAIVESARISRVELKNKQVLLEAEGKLKELVAAVSTARKQGSTAAQNAQAAINKAVEHEAKLRREIRELEKRDRQRGAPENPAFREWEADVASLRQQRSVLVGQRHALTAQAEGARHGVLSSRPELGAKRGAAAAAVIQTEEAKAAAISALNTHLQSRPQIQATSAAALELEEVRKRTAAAELRLRQHRDTTLRERRQLQELSFLSKKGDGEELEEAAKQATKIHSRRVRASEAKARRKLKVRLVEQDLADALKAGLSRPMLTGDELADEALGAPEKSRRTLKRRISLRQQKEAKLKDELHELRTRARELAKDKSLSPEQAAFEQARLELEDKARTSRSAATAARVARAAVESEIGVAAAQLQAQKLSKRDAVGARIRETQAAITAREGEKPSRLLEREKSQELRDAEAALAQAKARTESARGVKAVEADSANRAVTEAERELAEGTSKFESLKAKLSNALNMLRGRKAEREVVEKLLGASELETQLSKQAEIDRLKDTVKAAVVASTEDVDQRITDTLKTRDALKEEAMKAREAQLATERDDPARLRMQQRILNESKAASEENRRLVEAKRLEVAEARRHIAEMRDTRAQIRQHLAGAVFDLVTKFAFITGYLRSVGRIIADAAKFRFEATGLTAMLDKTRGVGEDIYGRYARSAAYQSEVSPAEAVARMTEFAAAGYGETEIPRGVESLFNVMLASRGEVTAGGAADLGISLHRAFGGAGVDMASLMDTAVGAANRFPMTIGKVRDALGYATEAAVQADQTLEETLITIGSIMPITKTASKAGTITRNAIISLARPKGQKILQDLGVMPKDSAGNMRPIMDVFLEISRKLEEVAGADDSVLKMKKEELEFALTGQRGGAIFAAIERMPELASAALRGTIYEQRPGEMPYVFANAEDALKAMRLGLMDTAGEARRMADQLRKTSYMLGESFDVSLEKFRISLGTFMLPMRDAMVGMAKNLVDGLTKWLDGNSEKEYGQPGGRPAGSSITANLVGGGLLVGGSILAARAVMTLMRTGGMLRALTQPKRIEEMTALMREGMSMGEAFARTSPQGGVGRWSRFSKGTADFLASAWTRITPGVPGGAVRTAANSDRIFNHLTQAIPSVAGKFLTLASTVAPVVGSLMLLNGAVTSARRAITDYTDITRSDHQRRIDRQVAGLKTVYQAAMEGRLSVDKDGNIRGIRENEMKSVLGGGSVVATAALNIARGMDPEQAFALARRRIAEEASFQFQTDPEEQKKALTALNIRMDTENEEFFSDSGKQILARQRQKALRAGDTGRVAKIDTLMASLEAQRLGRDIQLPILGQEKGGEDYALIYNFLKDTGAPDLDTALSKSSVGQRNKFRTMMLNYITEQQFKGSEGSLGGMVGKGLVGGWSAVMSSVFGYGEDVISDKYGNVKMADYNELGQWKAGMVQTFGQLNSFQKQVHEAGRLFSQGTGSFDAAVKRFENAIKNPVIGPTGVRSDDNGASPTRTTTSGEVSDMGELSDRPGRKF